MQYNYTDVKQLSSVQLGGINNGENLNNYPSTLQQNSAIKILLPHRWHNNAE